jgi:hypothetical protein
MTTGFSTAPSFRPASIAVVAVLVSAVQAGAQTAPADGSATSTPKVHFACYVPGSGTVYRIRESNTRQACSGPEHVLFQWTDGQGALRSGDSAGGDLAGSYPDPTVAGLQGRAVASTAPQDEQVLVWSSDAWRPKTLPSAVTNHSGLENLGADDHPQYLLADGSRGLTGSWNIGGFRIAGLAAATSNGEAVRFEQAVKGGDAAAGDLSGSYPDPTVRGIRGRPVSEVAPVFGQVLAFDGTEWIPSQSAGGVSDHGQLSGLGADDHPQYLLAEGERVSQNGFAVTAGLNVSGMIPASGQGTRLMWYPARAAFRAGMVEGTQWNEPEVGYFSTAFGRNTRASGYHSTAFGTATTASGDQSTAMGSETVASGQFSTAMGGETRASGEYATAIGRGTVASGNYSIAMGAYASTDGREGAVVFGDASTAGGPNSLVTATAPNQFVVRASGGLRFRTSADLSSGCDLAAGSGSWNCTSSRHTKMNFTNVDGEDLLGKIAAIPIQSWSYINEGGHVRHLGPTAQDFHAAFGLGSDDTTIGTVDIAGVNMLGVQALEARTRDLRAQSQLVHALERRIRQLEERLSALEAQMLP